MGRSHTYPSTSINAQPAMSGQLKPATLAIALSQPSIALPIATIPATAWMPPLITMEVNVRHNQSKINTTNHPTTGGISLVDHLMSLSVRLMEHAGQHPLRHRRTLPLLVWSSCALLP
jgi:hypothetical protein